MTLFIISRPVGGIGGFERIGATEGIPAQWFASNGINEDTSGYKAEEAEDIDCHDVEAFLGVIAARMGLAVDWQFVPFSQSRNAEPYKSIDNGKPWKSLNWKGTLKHNGRALFEFDYSQGTANCPASNKLYFASIKPESYRRRLQDEAIETEIETGKIARHNYGGKGFTAGHKPIDPPLIGAALSSLARDADVLDSSGFEDWATECGYNPDSIRAKGIFDSCMSYALALQAAIGRDGLAELQTVARFN